MDHAGLSKRIIEDLKAAFPSDTRGLVKEVANRIFLAGGWPTRQGVRDVIQRGSMTTIDAALREWKEALRRQTRAAIEVPDIPEALVPAFQSAVKGLWEIASSEATAAFDDERAKLARAVEDVSAKERAAVERGDVLDAALRECQEEQEGLKLQIAATERELAEAREAGAALEATLETERESAKSARAEQLAAMEKISAERAREREALEGQLSFATRQIDEAREKSKGLVADLERERKRGERIEAQARDDADQARAALDARLKERDEALADAARAQETASGLRQQVETLQARLEDAKAFADRTVEAARHDQNMASEYVALLKKAFEQRQERSTAVMRESADVLAGLVERASATDSDGVDEVILAAARNSVAALRKTADEVVTDHDA